MTKHEMREFIKDVRNVIAKCEPTKRFETSLANSLKSDYAILLSFDKRITILNLNETGQTSDGEEWVQGALGNMRMSRLPIYLVSNSQLSQAKNFVTYAMNTKMIKPEMCGWHMYKWLKPFSKRYDY
jgi:hypothetical protein